MEAVALDTNVFILAIEQGRGWGQCARVIGRIEAGEVRGVVSTIVLAELSVGYHLHRRQEEARALFARLQSPPWRVVPVDASIAHRGGEIRAATGLALPDALIVATALEAGVDRLLSDDKEFRKVKRIIHVVSPKDFGF